MTTLIIAATEFELAVLVEALQCRQESRLLDFTVYQTGSSTDDRPIMMRCGAGIANAAAAAALGIALYKPDAYFQRGRVRGVQRRHGRNRHGGNRRPGGVCRYRY